MVGGTNGVSGDSVVVTTRSDYELGASGNLLRLHTVDNFGRDEREYHHAFGFIDNLGTRFYYHRDHLGNVRAVSDASGNSVRWTDYFAYGAIRDEWNIGQVRDNYRYNSKELDTETGLLYYGARYFEPMIGNWTTTDPMHEYPSAYIYVGNRPTISIDPDGRRTLIDKDGVVTQILNDGDKSVWQQRFTDDGAEYYIQVGETEFVDEFAEVDEIDGKAKIKNNEEYLVQDGAFINFNKDWDDEISVLNQLSSQMGTTNSAKESFEGGMLDIKSRGNAYEGRKLNGKYATRKSAGNYLAGMNAATLSNGLWSVERTMKVFGAINATKGIHSKLIRLIIAVAAGLEIIKPLGTHPYYGEIPYSGRMQRLGILEGCKGLDMKVVVKKRL